MVIYNLKNTVQCPVMTMNSVFFNSLKNMNHQRSSAS